MVEREMLIKSKLAHIIVIVLGVVGVVAVATGVVTETVWFWIVYGLVWLTFFELFEEKSAFWETIYGDGNAESTEQASSVEETADPVTVLKQRYAGGAIDDEEFEARLDRLLETPDTLAELEAERET